MNTIGVLDFQIGVEKKISKLYEDIAAQFSSNADLKPEWVTLWEKLARDEADHAALLSIEKKLLQTGTRIKKPVVINQETKKEIETLLAECEEKISEGLTQDEAVQILKKIEYHDNRLFSSLLEATDSKLLSQFILFSKRYKAHERRVHEGLTVHEAEKMEVVDV